MKKAKLETGQVIEAGGPAVLDGPRIKSIRLALGLTQSEFASALHTEQARVSCWENDRHRLHRANQMAILALWKRFRGNKRLPLPSLEKFRVKGPVRVNGALEKK